MAVWQQDNNGIYNAYARYFVPTVQSGNGPINRIRFIECLLYST